jgi:hypothetical protein
MGTWKQVKSALPTLDDTRRRRMLWDLIHDSCGHMHKDCVQINSRVGRVRLEDCL